MHLKCPGRADGRYIIKAKGSIIAILFWGDKDGMLPGWRPFAYVPVDPYGNGSFYFSGQRAIPYDATTVVARCISSDFKRDEYVSEPIPERFLPTDGPRENSQRFTFLSDMHLAAKPWKITRAFSFAESDMIFLLGDSANDGTGEQFGKLKEIVGSLNPSKAVLSVIGNHDCLHPGKTAGSDGTDHYASFQSWLTKREPADRLPVELTPEGLEWSLQMGDMDIIGLQCVASGRKFVFQEGRQIEWLRRHLSERKDLSRHIVLCHAPLLAHNPNRNDGNPYLDRNREIQKIMDESGNIIFLSGHTHVSPNTYKGSAEFDKNTGNIYIDCGSVVTTSLEGEGGVMDPSWNDGCLTELIVGEGYVEVRMHSSVDGMNFPRGYYRFCQEDEIQKSGRNYHESI